MKRLIYICLGMLCTGKALAQNETILVQDTTYESAYYLERENQYKSLKHSKYDVVFFGNSITERGPWQELIGSKYIVGNRGIGADNTFGMKARIKTAIASKPQKIFLMMGINDIGCNYPLAWSLNNYEQIIKIIKRESPSTKIYVQYILPLNESVLGDNYLMGKEKSIKELNKGIQHLAKKHRLTDVDLKKVLANGSILKSEYTDDGVHLNRDAYIKWIAYLKQKKYL